MKAKKIEVEWLDAVVRNAVWESPDVLKETMLEHCSTRGYLIHETDEALYVVQTLGSDMCLNGVVIPRGTITKVKYG